MKLVRLANEVGHGSRNSSLVVRCAHSYHHPTSADLALKMRSLRPVATDVEVGAGNEAAHSAVSWAAVFAGTFATLATTLILLALGAGLGFTSISPWPNAGASITTFSIMTGIGLILVQWISSALGGFLTGRLRTKWVNVHTYEVFFRDTAHGFLTWALATVVGALLLASAASSIIGGGARAVGAVAGEATQAGAQLASQAASSISGYDVDSLFRSDKPDTAANPQQDIAQTTRILAAGLSSGDMPPADKAYLAQLISNRTGISQADAQKRLDDVFARAKDAEVKARQAADAARKAAAQLSIFTALSMLIGAFIASAAAAYGGSSRDD